MYPSILIRFREKALIVFMLLIIVQVTASCASAPLELVKISPGIVPNAQRFDGSVNVQALTILTIPENQPLDRLWERHPFVDRHVLNSAMEETITNNKIFTRVEQTNADYLLDIWVDYQEVHAPGLGTFWSGVSSVWRLTRVSDGEMHGRRIEGLGIVTKGMGPSTRSMIGALQSMIVNGLQSLSDPSMVPYISLDGQIQLCSQSIAHYMTAHGMKRKHFPEGDPAMDRLQIHAHGKPAIDIRPHIEPWMNNVRQNWGKLRAGMTLYEVEETIGPVRTSGAILDFLVIWQPTETFPEYSERLPGPTSAWQLIYPGDGKHRDYQCRSGIYTLVFKDDQLLSWKLY